MSVHNLQEKLAQVSLKKNIERQFEAFFEEKGFSLIQPKTFQGYDEFMLADFKGDPSRIVKVLGGESKLFVLRPDITTNILGGIFAVWDRADPLRLYYNSKIYNNDSSGGIEEHSQMGVESLGLPRCSGDLQIFRLAAVTMEKLCPGYLLELGSCRFLEALFDQAGFEPEVEKEILQLIANKNRGALLLRLETLGLTGTIWDSLLELQGAIDQVLLKTEQFSLSAEMAEALAEIVLLRDPLGESGLIGQVKLDLALVPDQDYYDGIVFKGYCPGIPTKVLSGGRYDKLTERFGTPVSAIGFMFDLALATCVKWKEGESGQSNDCCS